MYSACVTVLTEIELRFASSDPADVVVKLYNEKMIALPGVVRELSSHYGTTRRYKDMIVIFSFAVAAAVLFPAIVYSWAPPSFQDILVVLSRPRLLTLRIPWQNLHCWAPPPP